MHLKKIIHLHIKKHTGFQKKVLQKKKKAAAPKHKQLSKCYILKEIKGFSICDSFHLVVKT